jgi:outer membrane murein-binding lipoprotein Lpp
MANAESWHLSKSVPITLIFGLITQGAAIVWTVSMMMGDISYNRNNIQRLDLKVEKLETMVHEQALSLARIDENIKAIRSAVEAMAAKPSNKQ